jgi:hypothetical protein
MAEDRQDAYVPDAPPPDPGPPPAPSEQERFLEVARRVLVEGPIPASLHDAYAQIERAVRGEG